MNNKQIRERLSRAAADSTPDVLQNVLLGCEQQKGAVLSMNKKQVEISKSEIIKKKRKTWARVSVAMAAVLAFAIMIPMGIGYYSVDSVIGIDVNPSIEIKTNSAEKVLSVTSLNDDAAIVLDGMNLKNVDIGVAVNALIGSMLRNGYVDEIKNSILITVENSDAQRGTELQERLSTEVNTLLNANFGSGAVISQMVSEDERLRALADQHGISIGKAALVDHLIGQDDRLKAEDIAKLSINEITLLIAARQPDMTGVTVSGQASSNAYIGEEAAKAAALAHAEVDAQSVIYSKAKLDYDDGSMVYEIEFNTADAEYEYEIDAVSGTVRSYDKDMGRGTSQQPQDANADYIGEEKAKTIALEHAGLKAADVTFIKAHLDHDDGRAVYDVEFYSGNVEYDYEIDAVSGDIREYDRDIENYSISHGGSSHSGSSGTSSSGSTSTSADYIGEAKAKSIALEHAGLSEADVTRMKVSLDRDDGRVEYEVEFNKGRMEYQYDIDAVTGSIIEWDHDYDD